MTPIIIFYHKRHYKPWLVYSLLLFWSIFLNFQGVFFEEFCPVFRSGLYLRAVYGGPHKVFISTYPIPMTLTLVSLAVRFALIMAKQITTNFQPPHLSSLCIETLDYSSHKIHFTELSLCTIFFTKGGFTSKWENIRRSQLFFWPEFLEELLIICKYVLDVLVFFLLWLFFNFSGLKSRQNRNPSRIPTGILNWKAADFLSIHIDLLEIKPCGFESRIRGVCS